MRAELYLFKDSSRFPESVLGLLSCQSKLLRPLSGPKFLFVGPTVEAVLGWEVPFCMVGEPEEAGNLDRLLDLSVVTILRVSLDRTSSPLLSPLLSSLVTFLR